MPCLAVTERSPFTIAPTRVAGTGQAIASALIDIPRGLRNSSFNTSPRWAVIRLGVAIVLVVVDDFDIGGSFLSPGVDSGDDRLRASTRALIDGCWQNGGAILLSAITVWEIALR